MITNEQIEYIFKIHGFKLSWSSESRFVVWVGTKADLQHIISCITNPTEIIYLVEGYQLSFQLSTFTKEDLASAYTNVLKYLSRIKDNKEVLYAPPCLIQTLIKNVKKDLINQQIDIGVKPYLEVFNRHGWLTTKHSCYGHSKNNMLEASSGYISLFVENVGLLAQALTESLIRLQVETNKKFITTDIRTEIYPYIHEGFVISVVTLRWRLPLIIKEEVLTKLFSIIDEELEKVTILANDGNKG